MTAQVKVTPKVDGQDTPADDARLVKILHNANYRGQLVFGHEEDEDPYNAISGPVAKLRAVVG